MSEEVLEKIFTVPTPARLMLGNIRGSVIVETGVDGEITLRAEKQADTGDADQTEIQTAQAEDGSVSVETRYRENFSWLFSRRPCKVDYVVRVPRQCSLKISGVSNRTAISGVEGDLAISTVSGPLALKDISGQIRVKAVSGKVECERLSARLAFETVSGGISLLECSLPSIEGSTVSGNVAVETSLGDGPYHLKSVSGGVAWRLPQESACSVEINSLSGRLRTSLPRTSSQASRRSGPGVKESLDLNGGGVRISYHSVSGDMSLESRPSVDHGQTAAVKAQTVEKAEAADEARPVQEAKPSFTKMEILERIERGEMTVEQGVALMK